MEKNVLFRRFLRNPIQVGALCPSSRALCSAIVSRVEIEKAEVIVELGPGTGVITQEIVQNMSADARLLAIELDPLLCEHLRKKFPAVTICNDSAAGVGSILEKYSLSSPNVIISGIPWANFSSALQWEILNSVAEHMKPGGYFSTFAYLQGMMLASGQRFRRMLCEVFDEVTTSSIVWNNLPPAFVYRCRKR